jgi:division protein CdvB (Snf7/Vps24/ESCRT-III family)
MTDFKTMWLGKDKGVSDKIKEHLAPKKQLRTRIEQAIRALELQNRKLEVALRSLREKDKYYYSKVLNAIRAHDRSRAVLYANELAELRKAVKSISTAKLALEQIALRLSTVKDIGDVMVAISPAMSVVKGVRDNITHILPQAENELSEIQDILTRILVDAGQMAGVTIDFRAANDEAERILKEAEAQVEREMKERLPGIPSFEGPVESPKESEFMF